MIKNNLTKNGGNIFCEICGKKMTSIEDCHFDHIFPFAKGGKSTSNNCQILCSSCNLKKNDKLLQDFIIEEKARAFLSGMSLEDNNTIATNNDSKEEIVSNVQNEENQITKEIFDKVIKSFIEKHGTIQRIDFAREYNNLPSFSYVKQYYGGLLELKDAFGIRDQSFYWDRDSIKEALVSFVDKHGTLTQKDLCKSNGLPSIPCILRYYPEYASLSDIQKNLLGLDGITFWDKESAIVAGKEFMKTHDCIHQKDFKAENNLPNYGVINKLFGTLNAFQEEIGAPLSTRNEFISKEEIHRVVEKHFDGKERIIENQVNFEKDFSIKLDIIRKRYGSFDNFCEEEGISLSKKKIFKYSKREVDDAISNWVLQGNGIPRAHDLTKVGLPSPAVIMRFYKDWREPFVMYQKLHEEVNRVK